MLPPILCDLCYFSQFKNITPKKAHTMVTIFQVAAERPY